MEMVTVSSRYQVVIPEGVRAEMKIRPGDKMAVLVKHGVVQLVPIRSLSRSKGLFKGLDIDQTALRDHGDRS